MGCCMHKELNSVKGGNSFMMVWWVEAGATGPVLLNEWRVRTQVKLFFKNMKPYKQILTAHSTGSIQALNHR